MAIFDFLSFKLKLTKVNFDPTLLIEIDELSYYKT